MTSTNQSKLNKAAEYYGFLFSLPTYREIVFLTIIISSFGSIIAFKIAYNTNVALLYALFFSFFVLIIPIILTDVMVYNLIIDKSIILNIRRGSGLSIFTCIIYVINLIIGAFVQSITKNPFLLGSIMAFSICLTISFRYIVVYVTTDLDLMKSSLLIILQPILCLFSTLTFFDLVNPSIIFACLIASLVTLSASYLFIRFINRKSQQIIGIDAIPLFKSFLYNWIADLSHPLETYIDKLGSVSSFRVSILAFKKEKALEAILVIPTIHPGPFKNVGSSNLPYLIQKTIENKYNCTVAVPHGTCDHRSNLTSQEQNRKVLEQILKLIKFDDYSNHATIFVREEENHVKASCQIFGDIALVTITCAPENMEDIPNELGLKIIERAKTFGLKDVIVIDAHNSMSNYTMHSILTKEILDDIISASSKVIIRALKEKKQRFKVGVERIYLKNYGVEEGFGPGGITIIVIIVGKQRSAYIVIDGNNMIRGLREEILKSLKELIDEGEVLTTDTHVVNAVLSVKRGYHTVGEVVNKIDIVSNIKKGVKNAIKNADNSSTEYNIMSLCGIKSMGESVFKLSNYVDLIYNYVKKLAVILYVPSVSISVISFVIILFSMI